jgi:hypothetical protein
MPKCHELFAITCVSLCLLGECGVVWCGSPILLAFDIEAPSGASSS